MISQKAQSADTQVTVQDEVNVDIVVEDLYNDERRYAYAVSSEEPRYGHAVKTHQSIKEFAIEEATDTTSRHTLIRRATRKAVNKIPDTADIVIRTPTNRWQETALALGNMRDRSLDVQLRKENSQVYSLIREFLKRESMENMVTDIHPTTDTHLNLYVDGSTKYEQSYGWILTDSGKQKVYDIGSETMDTKRNTNRIEIEGIIQALDKVPEHAERVFVFCDNDWAVEHYGNRCNALENPLRQKILRSRIRHKERKVVPKKIQRDQNPADIVAYQCPRHQFDI